MSLELEKIIIGSLINNSEFRSKVQPFIKRELFTDSAIVTIGGLIRTYQNEYRSFPNEESLKVELDSKPGLSENVFQATKSMISTVFSPEMEGVSKRVELKWILDKTEKYLKTQSCHNAVMESIGILDGENKKLTADAIPDILKAALAISFDVNVGHDYFEDFEERFNFYHNLEERIPFRLSGINFNTEGGIPRKSLVVPVAPTGVGKSLFLTDEAGFFIQKGLNVLYVTLEMAEKRIAERVDACLMDFTMADLKTCPKDTFDAKISHLKKNAKGKLKVKEYPPGTFHSNHLRFLLQEYKNKEGFVPDVIMVDYINLMASYRMKDASNSYAYIKAVAEELRGVAMETDTLIISPTQTNRSGQNASDFELNEVSESHGISMTADVMFGFISTPDLESLGHMRIKMLKNRFGQTGTSFVVAINRAKMQIRDLDTFSAPDPAPTGPKGLNKQKSNTGAIKF